MDAAEAVVVSLWILSTAIIVIFYVEAVVLSLFGIRRPRNRPDIEPRTRFAVVIPAHNEAAVLLPLLDDLRKQEYPSDLFDVYVIADNCTDGTASVAESAPGVTVIQRNGGRRSKGEAIRYGLERIFIQEAGQPRYDAFAFFDADNRVMRNFLQQMNNALRRGERFVQAYLGTKNPGDNWMTRVVSLSYAMTNRLWQLGRYRVGMPNQCGGTGFCLDAGIVREIGWPTSTLTEDLELGCLLADRGIFCSWCHETVVYDEKPTSFGVAFRQRVRWMKGHLENMRLFSLPLLRKGFVERRLKCIDMALYLQAPLFLIAVSLQGVLWLVSRLVWPAMPIIGPGVALLVLVSLVMLYYPMAGIYLETGSLRGLVYLPHLLLFNSVWVAAVWTAVLTYRRREWYHTPHLAQLDEAIQL